MWRLLNKYHYERHLTLKLEVTVLIAYKNKPQDERLELK